MSEDIIITMGQINPIMGDVATNAAKIGKFYQKFQSFSDIIIFPELCLYGYSPEDLVKSHSLYIQTEKAINKLCLETKGSSAILIVGAIYKQENMLYNSAYCIKNGKIIEIACKNQLPNYGVFDEKRNFTAGTDVVRFTIKNKNIALLICEDMWIEETVAKACTTNTNAMIVINASPFERTKLERRLKLAETHTTKYNIYLAYVNQIGGQDSVVYDGSSFVMNNEGKITCMFKSWQEEVAEVSLFRMQPTELYIESHEERLYQATVLALRDYINKNHLHSVIIGISGGIDSALSASIAVDALGKDRVTLVTLPTRFTSQNSFDDAAKLCKNLNIKPHNIEIENIFESYLSTLDPIFAEKKWDLTEENLQSRIRGSILMALSNKLGGVVLSNGNKSELACGYFTLYGDSCGAFNVLKDLYKRDVLALAKWRNENFSDLFHGNKGEIIPESIITKEPTAELRENQKDSDSLPPYNILDEILYKHIEEELSADEIIAAGFEEEAVKKIIKLVKINEYKRKQTPLGPKLSKISFGLDRRYPNTNQFNE